MEDFVYALMYTTVALVVLLFAATMLKLTWELTTATWHALFEVRWGRVLVHSGAGFVVSSLVAPSLPAALAMAAGMTSGVLTWAIMHRLESIEIRKPARARARR